MPKLRKMMTASEVLAYLDAKHPLNHEQRDLADELVRLMSLKSSLSAVLVERRKALNLTQGELASRAGIEQSEISKLEGPEGNPTLKTLTKVADALDLDFKLVPREG
jgi:DNA-binding phage protein